MRVPIKSSVLIGFSIGNHFGVPPCMETPIFAENKQTRKFLETTVSSEVKKCNENAKITQAVTYPCVVTTVARRIMMNVWNRVLFTV